MSNLSQAGGMDRSHQIGCPALHEPGAICFCTRMGLRRRFFLDSDNDGHWYVIPAEKRSEWEVWSNLDGEDERAWDTPEWAVPINGAQSRVTFEEYRIG